jgi:hypothetical protein
VAIPPRLEGPAQVSIPEEIEWTWEVRPAGSDPGLPNVVLLGDSIIATKSCSCSRTTPDRHATLKSENGQE